MSSRHQDELEAQYNENFWLKKSLLECSNALHDAVALLKNVKQDQNSAPVPPILFEIAAKFNYENVVSACKCAICPTPSAAPSVNTTPMFSSSAVSIPENNRPAVDNIQHNNLHPPGQDPAPASSKPASKSNNESTLALFKNLKRDATGLYVVAPSAGLKTNNHYNSNVNK